MVEILVDSSGFLFFIMLIPGLVRSWFFLSFLFLFLLSFAKEGFTKTYVLVPSYAVSPPLRQRSLASSCAPRPPT